MKALFAGVVLLAACSETQNPQGSLPPPAHPSPSDLFGSLHVGVERGIVTVKARDARLEDVVESIAGSSGLVLVVEGSLDERVTLNLRQPLGVALRLVLRDRSFVLHQAARSSPTEGATDARMGALFIFREASAPRISTAALADSAGKADVRAADSTIAMLSDADLNARLDAVSALADFESDQAVPALTMAALDDAHEAVREAAVYVLSSIPGMDDDARTKALQRALRDSNGKVREAAVNAFGSLAGDVAVASLAIALNDAEPFVRAAAVEALGQIGDFSAVRTLRRASSDQRSDVREAAAEMLDELQP